MIYLLKDVKVNRIISPEDEVASAIVNQWRTPGAFDVAEFARSSVTMLGVSCKNDCPILDTPLRNLIFLSKYYRYSSICYWFYCMLPFSTVLSS